MTPDERARLDRIICLMLGTIARETRLPREELSLEIEQVVSGGVFEAYRVGNEKRTVRRRSSATIPAVTESKETDDG